MQKKIIEALEQFDPYSVFVYGSRGRGDHKPDSDYEIGVIFEDEKYVSRRVIHKVINLEKVRIYPFKLSAIKSGEIDTPFQKNIYMRELAEAGKTISGEKIIENLESKKITTLDLIQRIRFDIGYALAAVLSDRSGDLETAHEEFSKSCLFGLNSLIILKLRKFIVGYDKIFELKNEVLDKEEYLDVVKIAYSLRGGETEIPSDAIFRNISFLQYVENEIISEFSSNGATELA